MHRGEWIYEKHDISSRYLFYVMGLFVGRRILNSDQDKKKEKVLGDINIVLFAFIDQKCNDLR